MSSPQQRFVGEQMTRTMGLLQGVLSFTVLLYLAGGAIQGVVYQYPTFYDTLLVLQTAPQNDPEL